MPTKIPAPAQAKSWLRITITASETLSDPIADFICEQTGGVEQIPLASAKAAQEQIVGYLENGPQAQKKMGKITEYLEELEKSYKENNNNYRIANAEKPGADFSKKTEDFSASLRGFSPDREYLSQFKKNLESNASFKDVNFPPSTWVKPRDIEFSISFKKGL